MPQMLMITQNYIHLYFRASFSGLFCRKIKYFKKIENWFITFSINWFILHNEKQTDL